VGFDRSTTSPDVNSDFLALLPSGQFHKDLMFDIG
jgi:hypothetical protein